MLVPKHLTTGKMIPSEAKSPSAAPKWEEVTFWQDDDEDGPRFVSSQYA